VACNLYDRISIFKISNRYPSLITYQSTSDKNKMFKSRIKIYDLRYILIRGSNVKSAHVNTKYYNHDKRQIN